MMISVVSKIFPSPKLIERQIVNGTEASKFESYRTQAGKQENHNELFFLFTI